MWISCFYPLVSQNLPSETCPFLSSPFYSSLSALFIHPLADSVFTSKMQSRQMGASGKNMTKSTSISGDMYTLEKNDGSQSDTAVGTVGGGGKKRRSSIGAKMVAIVGLSRKSRSTSQLSQTGRNWIFFLLSNYHLNVPNIYVLWFNHLDILLKLPNQQYSTEWRKRSNIFFLWTFTKLFFLAKSFSGWTEAFIFCLLEPA